MNIFRLTEKSHGLDLGGQGMDDGGGIGFIEKCTIRRINRQGFLNDTKVQIFQQLIVYKNIKNIKN